MDPVDKAPTFMTLPAELRLRIYELVLIPSPDLLLKTSWKLPRLKAPVDNRVLRVNKQIHRESLPQFYATYTFHFSIELHAQPSRTSIRDTHESYMKHLSIDTRVQFTPWNDDRLAREINVLIERFVSLRTLTLHFLPLPYLGYPTLYQKRIPGQKRRLGQMTISALRTLLSTLNKMSIVVYGSPDNLSWLRESITSEKDAWVREQVVRSPGVKPAFVGPSMFITGSRLEDQYRAQCSMIHAFHTYKPGFRPKLKEDWESS